MLFMQRLSLAGALLVATIGLAACGGGDAPTSTAPVTAPPPAVTSVTLSGVAAVGDPVVGATVRAQCANGASAASLPTSTSGAWTIAVAAAALPCGLQVSGGTVAGAANTLVLHAIAVAAGITNITPLTDLAIARAAGRTPSEWFAALGTTPAGARLDPHTATTQLLAALAAAGYTMPAGSGFDPFTATFEARTGDAYDNLLDTLRIAMARDSRTYGDLLVQFVSNLSAAITLPQATATVVVDPGTHPSGPIVLTPKFSATAADIAPMVGTWQGTLGRVFTTGQPTVDTSSCTITVTADGMMTVAAGGRSIGAAVNGDGGDLILAVQSLFRIQASDTTNDRYAQLTTVRGVMSQGVARQGGTGFTTASDRVECTVTNPSVTSAGTTTVATLQGATAADMAASLVGTYTGGGCTLTLSSSGVLHLISGDVNVTTTLGGDPNDIIVLAAGSVGIQAQDYFAGGVETYVFFGYSPGTPSLNIPPSYTAEARRDQPRPGTALANCSALARQ